MATFRQRNKIKTTEREKRLQRRVKELSTLYEISKLLTSAMELDEILSLIVETTAKTLGVKACSLRLLNEKTGEMALKAAYGLSEDYMRKGQVFAWRGVYRDVISDGGVAIVYDAPTDPRFEYSKEAQNEGIKSMLIVGLLIQDKPIGGLAVYVDRFYHFSQGQIQIFKGIANEAASVIEKAILYEERVKRQRIEQEITAAAKIQANLMPQFIPKMKGCDIAARNIPSKMIGGDFYDFITFGETHLGTVIADVSGKGISGAILMASARATLRAYLEDPHTVEESITKLNRVLCRDTQAEQFVTLFYGMLDISESTLTYVNAGHNPPILFRKSEMLFLQKGGMILGVIPDTEYEEEKLQLKKGDIVVFYTDGVTEASKDNEYFGIDTLSRIVKENMSLSANEIMDKILKNLFKFVEDSFENDDTTIIVLKYLG